MLAFIPNNISSLACCLSDNNLLYALSAKNDVGDYFGFLLSQE
jgi:hypothetical protein